MSIDHRQLTNCSRSAAASEGVTPEGGLRPSDVDERDMLQFGVDHEGMDYYYNGYRYERLADALAYSRLRRSMPEMRTGL